VGPDREAVEQAVQACLDRMTGLEQVLSRFIPESQVSQLNRDGRLAGADVHLLEVIEQSRQISERSEGAFDITIQPLVRLYQDCLAAGDGLPGEDAVQRACRLVDYRCLSVSGDQVSLGLPGMAVTLDAIAKGYIVDQGVAVLRDRGFPDVLVEAGGDLLAAGQKGEGVPWRIGLQPPRQGMHGFTARLNLHDQAAATSGDYFQPFSPDLSEYHILDPRRGHSSPELASATILAPTAALADGLATAVMVLGVEGGLTLVRRFSGCQAYLVTKGLRVYHTQGFPLV
jgi:thiamine biosynthesis lipoprotein